MESLKIVSAVIWPFMPESSEKIQGQLGLAKKGRELTLKDLKQWGKEDPVEKIGPAPAVFPRVDTAKQKKPPVKQAPKTSETPSISFDHFRKMDLRVGTIRKAETIAGSKKLLKLTVDMGEERTVVAGLARHYTVQELEGKQVVIVANLEPAKLMGTESQGMVLAAEAGKDIRLVSVDRETPPGAKVR